MSATVRAEFLNDLCPQVRPLIADLMNCDCGCEILEFFRRRPLTSLQASDIAYHVRQSQAQVAETLNLLVGAKVIEPQKVLDFTFYGLTHDLEIQRALEQFWVWRDHWHTHLSRIYEGLQFSTVDSSSASR